MSRSTEESARWLLTSSIDVRTVRSRLYEIDCIHDLRIWVKVYNQVRDQMPPGRRESIVETIEKRHDALRDDR